MEMRLEVIKIWEGVFVILRHIKIILICIALCLTFFLVYNMQFFSKKQVCSNPHYTMFYGEWEITEDIYVDPIPVRDVIYSQSELEQMKEHIYKNSKIEKIQILPEGIIVNNTKKIENITYVTKIFPANDEYGIHFTLTLRDIGLTKDKAPYYAFVEVKINEPEFENIRFFLKDENTIIMYFGSYCVTYKKNTEGIKLMIPEIILG